MFSVCAAGSHANDEARVQFRVIEARARGEYRVRVHHARHRQVIVRVTAVVGDGTDEMRSARWRTDEVLHRRFLNPHRGH